MNDFINNKSSTFEDIDSGTANYKNFIEGYFQLTYDEALLDIHYHGDLPKYSELPAEDPPLKFLVLDGELRIVDEGSPPDMEPLSKDAGLFQARG